MDTVAPEGEAAVPPETTPAAQAETPPQPEAAAPQQPPAEDGESWEQRFRSQQGRLEQAGKTNQALNERLAQLEMLIASMKVRGAEEERPAAAVPLTKPKLITDKEAEEYGDEFLQVVGKRAKEEFLPEFESLAERLKRLEGRVEGVGTIIDKTQVSNVYTGVSRVRPGMAGHQQVGIFQAVAAAARPVFRSPAPRYAAGSLL